MSDFLHNLIARSYDLKPVARPRLASRFEPRSGSPLLNESLNAALESKEFGAAGDELNMNRAHAAREPFAEQALEISSTEETQPPTTDAEQFSVHLTKTKEQPSHAGLAADDANAHRLNAAAPTIATTSTQPPVASDIQSSVEQSAHASQAIQAAADASLGQGKAEGDSINHTVEVEREAALPERGGLLESSGQNIKEQFADEEQPPANVFSRGELEAQRARRGVVPAKVSAQSKMKESAESSAPVAAETRGAETAASVGPVIRVTIGRIDVRAVMPDSKLERPVASAPARRTHAPLSLEEYLKQRNGGGR